MDPLLQQHLLLQQQQHQQQHQQQQLRQQQQLNHNHHHHHNHNNHHQSPQEQPPQQLHQQPLAPFQTNLEHKQVYQNNTSDMFRSDCQYPSYRHEPTNDNIDEVKEQLMILVRKAQDIDEKVQRIRLNYEEFVIRLQARARLSSSVSNYGDPQYCSEVEANKQYKNKFDEEIKRSANDLNSSRRDLIASQYALFEELIAIQNKILYGYLPRWHHEQQLVNNGVPIEPLSLDLIQSWIEKIVDVIWRIKNQIKGLQLILAGRLNIASDAAQLDRFVIEINRALENLILSSFVVEKQPPQVMKTNTKFCATVRFLCGNKLNVQMINPTVKAIILSENNARAVIQYHKKLIESSWASLEGQWSECPPSQQSAPAQFGTSHLIHAQTNIMTQQQQQQQQQHQPMFTDSNSRTGTKVEPMHQTYNAPVINGPSPIATINDSSGLTSSPDQPMTMGDSQSPGHLFQQSHQTQSHPFHQQTYQNIAPHDTVGHQVITSCQQFPLTHIGYDPDFPPNSREFESSGGILNNSNPLEYQEANGQMVCNFRNMQLKKIKRAEKKGTESVMDEKFILLFFTSFRIADDSFLPYSTQTAGNSRVKRGDLLFHILAFSLPVVVIVHGNQEAHAWATVTWHNAFAEPDELLYKVPDRVKWRELGNVLSEKFRSATGQGLSQQNLEYLASKVYRNRADNDNVLITWAQFSKENLPDKQFTFWEWFHSIFKLTKDHLSPLWKAERIFGFIGKMKCIDLLLGPSGSETAPVGTFLLRFSETELGGITIAWVSSVDSSVIAPALEDRVQISARNSPTNSNSSVVMHLEPFYAKDLQTRTLADRIRDLKHLIYLYPDIPKDEAFKEYYTPIKVGETIISRESYVKAMLVTTLANNYPGLSANTHTEASVTPNSMSQSSPDGYYQDSVSMNDVMDQSFCPYGDFNYTLQ